METEVENAIPQQITVNSWCLDAFLSAYNINNGFNKSLSGKIYFYLKVMKSCDVKKCPCVKDQIKLAHLYFFKSKTITRMSHHLDLDLIVTYHCCERSMEVSKQLLDLHYTLRSAESFAFFFRERCFDKKVQFSLDTILYAPLPQPTVEGYRAVYLRLLDEDPRNFFPADATRTFAMIFDLWQYQEGTWPGFIIIIDMDKSTMGHVKRLEIMTIRKILYYLQECLLVKLKGVHFNNAPYFMDKLMLLLRPFIKKDLLDMIHIHPVGDDGIYNYVPRKAFPIEDGGAYKTREAIRDETVKRLQASAAFFQEENKKRVDETKRPGGKTSVLDSFGIQGSFKKLELD